jgi:hypothetical protein
LEVEKLKLPYPINAISNKAIKCIFRKRNLEKGWGRFYKKYPKSSGILSVSEIVFSENKRYCLFYLGQSVGSLDGYGCLLLIDLQAKNGKFIQKELKLWVS